jgi:hypothetical protein
MTQMEPALPAISCKRCSSVPHETKLARFEEGVPAGSLVRFAAKDRAHRMAKGGASASLILRAEGSHFTPPKNPRLNEG